MVRILPVAASERWANPAVSTANQRGYPTLHEQLKAGKDGSGLHAHILANHQGGAVAFRYNARSPDECLTTSVVEGGTPYLNVPGLSGAGGVDRESLRAVPPARRQVG